MARSFVGFCYACGQDTIFEKDPVVNEFHYVSCNNLVQIEVRESLTSMDAIAE